MFGNIETAKGRAVTETADRTWKPNAVEGVYRFLGDQVYVAARYNTAKGQLSGQTTDSKIDRTQIGGGWFVTQNIELKAEHVQQTYKDFPMNDIRCGGKFSGMM